MKFEVDSAEVARAAGSARVSASAIRAEVSNMMRYLTDLQAHWRGGASTAFAATASDWRTTQAQVEASLDQISLALDAGARTYEDAENLTMRQFIR